MSAPVAHMALVGVTASGKSRLAAQLAGRRPQAELVSIDSMAVYRHMDIGTAKPTPAERRRFRYHLIDLVDPEEEFTVRQFQKAAARAMNGIEGRCCRALLVGGTGLYLRVVVDGLDLPGRWPEVAAELERQADEEGGVPALHRRLEVLDPTAAARTTSTNRRRVVRALEVTIGSGRPFSSFGPGLGVYRPTAISMVGIPFDPPAVDAAIERRFRALLGAGLLEEVRRLAARPGGLSRTARQALGYRELLDHLEQGKALEVAVDEAIARTRAFARRQWAWFRRDPRIVWMDPSGDLLEQLIGRWDDVGAGSTTAASAAVLEGAGRSDTAVGDLA